MKYGYVRCNCYIQGKTIAPKNKEFLSITEKKIDWVVPEQEKYKDIKKYYLLESEFADWRLLACEHLDMDMANVFIGTIEKIKAFKITLEKLGGKNNYPVLVEQLTLENSNKLDVRLAQGLLREVEILQSNTIEEEKYMLLQKGSADTLASFQPDSPFIILNAIHANVHLCLGNQGFFINKHFEKRDAKLQMVVFSKTKEMFKSRHFIQETLPQNQYKFTDLSNGNSYETKEKLILKNNVPTTIEFEVIKKKTVVNEEYKEMLSALKTLAKASIETGNSIFME
jgi:hypothetical protein